MHCMHVATKNKLSHVQIRREQRLRWTAFRWFMIVPSVFLLNPAPWSPNPVWPMMSHLLILPWNRVLPIRSVHKIIYNRAQFITSEQTELVANYKTLHCLHHIILSNSFSPGIFRHVHRILFCQQLALGSYVPGP